MSTVLDGLLEQSDRVHLYEFCKQTIQKDPHALPAIFTQLYRTLMGNLDDADLHQTIAQLYYDFELYANALESCLDILSTKINYTPSYGLLSKLYYRIGDPQPIISHFELAINHALWFPIVIESLPKFYADHNRSSDLVWFYERWHQYSGSLSPYHMEAAHAYQANKQYHQAASAYHDYAATSPIARTHAIRGLKQLLRVYKQCGNAYQWLIHLLIETCNPDGIHPILAQVVACECPTTIHTCYAMATQAYPHDSRFWVLWLTAYTQPIIPWNETEYMRINHKLLALSLSETDTQSWVSTTHYSLNNHTLMVKNQVILLDILLDHHHDQAAYSCLATLLNTHALGNHPTLQGLMSRIGDQDTPMGLYLYAQWLIQTNQYATAYTILNRLYATPYHAKALLLASQLAKQRRHHPEMVQLLVHLVHRYPDTADHHHALINAHTYWCNEQRRSLTERSPKTQYQLGLLAFRDERLSDAIAHFQKIRFISKPKPQQLIGRCFLDYGLYSLAMDTLESSYAEAPDATTLYWLTCAAINAGDDAGSMRYHRQLMQTAIDTPGITELGQAVHQRQLHQSLPKLLGVALNWQQRTPHLIALPPIDFIAQNQRAYTHLNFSNHHNDTGVSQSLHHNIRDANQSFELAIQLNPEHYVARHNAAITQSMLQKKPPPLSGITRACSHLIHHNFSEALTDWLTFTKKKSVYYGLACLNVGDCYFHLNQVQSAYHYWQLSATTAGLAHLVYQRFYHLNPKRMGFKSIFLPNRYSEFIKKTN